MNKIKKIFGIYVAHILISTAAYAKLPFGNASNVWT